MKTSVVLKGALAILLISLLACHTILIKNEPIPDAQLIRKTELPDYQKLFKEGVSIDAIDAAVSKAVINREPIDTTGDDDLAAYSRWRSFWLPRQSKDGNLKKSLQNYLTALYEFSDYEICDGNSERPATWASLGPDEGPIYAGVPKQSLGAVFAIAADPNNLDVIYVGTGSGGLWKTSNGQDAIPVWTNVTDDLRFPSLGISDIIINPQNDQTIYAAASSRRHGYGLGIIKSINAGESWTETGLGFDPFQPEEIRKLLINPNDTNIVYAFTDKEVFRTTDSGETWPDVDFQDVAENLEINMQAMEMDIANPDILYVSGGERIWKANMASTQWTEISALSSYAMPTPNSGYTYNSSVVELSGVNNGCYALIKWRYTKVVNEITYTQTIREIKFFNETDNSWTHVSTSNHYGPLFVVNSDNPNMMYIGDGSGRTIRKSINGGSYFFAVSKYWPHDLYNGVSTHADIQTLKLLSASEDGQSDVLLAGNDGGALLSTSATPNGNNHKVNWRNINGKGLAITEFHGIAGSELDPYILHGGAQDNGLLTYDHGEWRIAVIGDGYDCLVDADDPSIAYGQINFPKTKRTTNKGISWGSFCNPYNCFSITEDWWKYSKWPMLYDVNDNMYIGHHDLFKKNDNQWIPRSDFSSYGVPDDWKLIAVDIAKSNTDIIYAAFPGPTWNTHPDTNINKLWKTINGGVSWTDITPPANSWRGISDLVSNPTNPDSLWVAFDGDGGSDSDGNAEHRVSFSPDGGATWQDWSEGLTRFPVNCIVYQEGSDNVIYVGTDVGVFYHQGPDGNTPWACFNDQLPATTVKDLEINYCAQKIRAATYGRGLWESDLAVPVSGWGEEIITADRTYAAPTQITQDLIIENGINVLVTNTGVLNIYPGRKIVVRQGATLTINGGTLTNKCGQHWQGIEVLGTISSAAESDQGKLMLKNGATISNAKEAVRLHNDDDYSTHGGIIIAKDSKFINNWRNVEFLDYPYSYQERGVFSNCEFILNNDFPASLGSPVAMVTMWAVDGIEFKGCLFEDQRNNFENPPNGINSIDAGYTVGPYCGGLEPCPKRSVFSNFNRAIYSTNSNSLLGIEVTETNFKNNNVGIFFNTVNGGAVIVKNKFDIGKASPNSFQFDIGLNLSNSSFFTVEDNLFEQGVSHDAFTCGMFIENTGPFPNDIYNNTINNLFIGVLTLGSNSLESDVPIQDCWSGLQFSCNDCNGNSNDFLLTNVQKKQGSINLPTGNSFSDGTQWHLALNSECGIDYYYNSQALTQTPENLFGAIEVLNTNNNNPCYSNWNDDGWEERMITSNKEFISILSKVEKEVVSLKTVSFLTEKKIEPNAIGNTFDKFQSLLYYIQRIPNLSINEKNKKAKELIVILGKSKLFHSTVNHMIKTILEEKTEVVDKDLLKELYKELSKFKIPVLEKHE